MLTANFNEAKDRIMEYAEEVAENDEMLVLVGDNQKSCVMISLEQYNTLLKAAKNLEYVLKLDRGLMQIQNSGGTAHEIIEVEDDD